MGFVSNRWKAFSVTNGCPERVNSHTQNKLVKEEQTKPKVSRRKGITKIRVEVNEIEVRKTTEKMNETG